MHAGQFADLASVLAHYREVSGKGVVDKIFHSDLSDGDTPRTGSVPKGFEPASAWHEMIIARSLPLLSFSGTMPIAGLEALCDLDIFRGATFANQLLREPSCRLG